MKNKGSKTRARTEPVWRTGPGGAGGAPGRRIDKDTEALYKYAGLMVRAALAEDIGAGDITTGAIVPKTRAGKCELKAKQEFVLSGLFVAEMAFKELDKKAVFKALLKDGERYIGRLAKVKGLDVRGEGERPKDAGSALAGEGAAMAEVFVPLKGLIDFDLERKRLDKELEKTAAASNVISLKLSNDAFLKKAPEEVVRKQRRKLEAILEKRSKLKASLERIKGLGG